MSAKKAIKKPSKKAAPPPKLIDGIYSHKFLTRYKPEDGVKLEALKKHFNEKTYMGTIIQMLNGYLPLLLNLQETRNELQATRNKLGRNSDLLSDLKNNFKRLMAEELSLDLTISTAQCKTCGEDLDKFGECPEGCDQD